MLTIAYITNRLEPKIEWFLDSLHRECGGNYGDIKTVIVDFYRDQPGRFSGLRLPPNVIHTAPKPTVWQGSHRLTKEDYFAASNTRNTAICYAPDGWIAYVDDLSVLMPGWMASVREAIANNYIVFGAYKKVLGLVIENGTVVGYRDYPPGVDSRWKHGRDNRAVVAAGSWLFGASLAAPVQAFLDINGWDEDCDSLGSEDYIAGIMLERAGYSCRYDQRMLTLESEELHATTPMRRTDKGVSPRDKSHAILNMVLSGRNRAPNYFGPDGIAGLRQKILAGEPFPVIQIPQNDWFDGQPISEF